MGSTGTGKYAALEQLLLRSHSLSVAERGNKLLSQPSLGDGTAVDLMDNMLSLLCSDEGGFLFLHIFLCQLPPLVCAALANSPCLAASNFCGLAEEADRLLFSSSCFFIQEVPSDTLQAATEDEDPLGGGAATCASSTSRLVAGLSALPLNAQSRQQEPPKPALSSSSGRW